MQTLECREAIEQLLAYLENPELDRAQAQAAIDHVSTCPDCGRRMAHLLRALTMDEEDRLTCRECQDLLPDYLQARAAGRVLEGQYQAVALHLETCHHCSAACATLSDLVELAYGERGEEPPYYPVPELSFLPGTKERKKDGPVQPAGMPWHLDELGRLIVEFSAELVRAFRPPVYRPAYVVAGVKSGKSQRILCRISLEEAVEDLDVTITAEETRDDPACCTVIVEADIPSRGGWPNLADTEVTLKRDGQQLATQRTDAFGKAVFEGVATDDLAHLVFEIAPRARPDHSSSDTTSL